MPKIILFAILLIGLCMRLFLLNVTSCAIESDEAITQSGLGFQLDEFVDGADTEIATTGLAFGERPSTCYRSPLVGVLPLFLTC